METDKAKAVIIDGESWAATPASDGGACLVGPDSTVACWGASAVAAGKAVVVRLDVTGPDGRASSNEAATITGLVPDSVSEIVTRASSGATVKTAPARQNTFRVKLEKGEKYEVRKLETNK